MNRMAYTLILLQTDLQKKRLSLSELSNLLIKYKRGSKPEAAAFNTVPKDLSTTCISLPSLSTCDARA